LNLLRLRKFNSISDGNTTFGGVGVTQYTLSVSSSGIAPSHTLLLSYSKPTSDFITDQSSNLNPLENFSNYPIVNLFRGISALAPGGGYDAIPTGRLDSTGQNILL